MQIKIAKKFPVTHPRKGELTNFAAKIASGEKKHTIRANPEFWERHLSKCPRLSFDLVQWSGVPYKSKTEVLKVDAWVITQRIRKNGVFWEVQIVNHWRMINLELLANNDGLYKYDFDAWFKKTEDKEELIIIHFAGYEYDHTETRGVYLAKALPF